MIYSMTAFARGQIQEPSGSFICEIRSINHRYLEISVYLPDALRSLEMPIRDVIRKFVKRGKVEVYIRYQAIDGALFSLNEQLAQELCRISEKIASFLPNPAPMNPTEILRFPGLLEPPGVDFELIQDIALKLVEKTLKDLLAARGREGEGLKQLFLQRMQLMIDQLNEVRKRLPSIMSEQRERLLKRLHEAKLELDPNRLEQEMVIYAHKIDVAEEIERSETHIAEIQRILAQGGVVGRRLDFLLQELNREANTLGSKSVDSVTTHAAVEMKVLIEQVREQVQNIE